MTPLQKLELAIQTLKARMDDESMPSTRMHEAAIAGATEVLVEAAIEALPAIEIVNARNKHNARKEVAA